MNRIFSHVGSFRKEVRCELKVRSAHTLQCFAILAESVSVRRFLSCVSESYPSFESGLKMNDLSAWTVIFLLSARSVLGQR